MQLESKIRIWVMGFPGLVVSTSPQGVLREALAMFTAATGTACNLAVFTDALWRAGYRPEQVGQRWQIALPTKPLGSESHFRRLRRIVR